jgi:hypothetical protein
MNKASDETFSAADLTVVQMCPDALHPQQLLKDFKLLKKEGIYVAFLFMCEESAAVVGFGQVRSSTITGPNSWLLQNVMIPHDPDALLTTSYYKDDVTEIHQQHCEILMELIVVVGLQFVESESDVHVL